MQPAGDQISCAAAILKIMLASDQMPPAGDQMLPAGDQMLLAGDQIEMVPAYGTQLTNDAYGDHAGLAEF